MTASASSFANGTLAIDGAQQLVGDGQSAIVGLELTGTEAGAINGTLLANAFSTPLAGTNLAGKDLGTAEIAFTGKVYRLADPRLVTETVNFVARGGAAPTGTVEVANAATGAAGYVETLQTQASGDGAVVTGPTVRNIAAGESGGFAFSFGEVAAGMHQATLEFTHTSLAVDGSGLGDFFLGTQTVGLNAMVTEFARAELFASGDGVFAGAGQAYTLDFGKLYVRDGAVEAEIAVGNTILSSAWAELLGGSFSLDGPSAFSFAGAGPFELGGGYTTRAGLLKFDPLGLTRSTYTASLLFRPVSRFAGFDDLELAPIVVNVSARVLGLAAVPEPATWAQMIAGFALAGAAARRRGQRVRSI